MRRPAALYGILGFIALIFAAVAYFGTAGFALFVLVNLVAGLLLIVMSVSSGWSTVGSFVGQRSTRYGANAIVYSVVFVLILIAVNWISNQHHARVDLTSERVFSLSSESVQVVRNLAKPLKMIGFFQGGDSPNAQQIYEEYAYASPKVTFELVDPDRHPELAEKYKVSVMNTTHLQYGGDDGEGSNVTDLTEEALTNAIIRVSKATRKAIYFLDGHGEADPDDATGQTGFGTAQDRAGRRGVRDQEAFARDRSRGPRRLHHPRHRRAGKAARGA